MTGPPQGRDGSPSVAALAVHLNGLRRDVDSLAAKMGRLASRQRKHATVLGDITELRAARSSRSSPSSLRTRTPPRRRGSGSR